MKQLTALSISIAILAGIATLLYLSVGTLVIWAAFLAWACFYHSGGDTAAFRSTLIGNTYGCFLGWIAAIVILAIPLAASIGLPAWAGIVVAVTVFIACYSANYKHLAVIPATFYGYAATFALLLQTPKPFLSLPSLLSPTFSNAAIVVAISLAIGTCFGLASAKIGAMLMAKTPTATQTA